MTIEQMCLEANRTIASHINRSAGQHIRAIKSASAPTPPTTSEIYAMCCESDTADQFAKWICLAAGVAFPPVNEGATQ